MQLSMDEAAAAHGPESARRDAEVFTLELSLRQMFSPYLAQRIMGVNCVKEMWI
jgi:hypothetical protein